MLGVAGGSANASTVRLAGVAGLLAGAFSMAAGELVSVRAQEELKERELQVEKLEELATEPEAEQRRRRRLAGVACRQPRPKTVARILSANAQVALDTTPAWNWALTRMQPARRAAAGVSFLAFAVGAVLPLLP